MNTYSFRGMELRDYCKTYLPYVNRNLIMDTLCGYGYFYTAENGRSWRVEDKYRGIYFLEIPSKFDSRRCKIIILGEGILLLKRMYLNKQLPLKPVKVA